MKPDAFLEEYAKPFNYTPSVVHSALKRLKITRKKAFTYYEKSEEKRTEYNRKVKRIVKNKCVYVDESGVHTFMQREYARSVQEEIGEDLKRGQKFARVNVIGVLNRHSASTCYPHTTNSNFFES